MKELLTKLSKVKAEIGKISKDSKNPFFKSKYFDINQLLEHVEPLLEKNGLLLIQPINNNCVSSEIYDIKTGEKVTSCLTLTDFNDPQKMGSAVTYYRRYTLQSLLAIQAEDDDGNKAANNTPKSKPSVTTKVDRKELTAEGYKFLMTEGEASQLRSALQERVIKATWKKDIEVRLLNITKNG